QPDDRHGPVAPGDGPGGQGGAGHRPGAAEGDGRPAPDRVVVPDGVGLAAAGAVRRSVSRRIPAEVLQRFRRVPLFSMLSPRALRLIVGAAREQDVPAGTVLVREGDRDRELFVVMRGEARVTRGGAVV